MQRRSFLKFLGIGAVAAPAVAAAIKDAPIPEPAPLLKPITSPSAVTMTDCCTLSTTLFLREREMLAMTYGKCFERKGQLFAGPDLYET